MKLERTLKVMRIERNRETGSRVLLITLEDPQYEGACGLLSFGPKDLTKNGFPYHTIRPEQELHTALERMRGQPADAEVTPDMVRLMSVYRLERADETGTSTVCAALFSSVPRAGEHARDAFGCERHLAPWHEFYLFISRGEYEKLTCLAQTLTFFKVSFIFRP